MSNELNAVRKVVPVAEIKVGSNTRKGVISASSVEDLAASIKEKGLLNPIVVMASGKGWEIVAGNRRFAAVKNLKWEEVEVLAYDELTETMAIEIGIIENIQRQDLSPVDEAKAFQQLMGGGHIPIQEVAARTGKKEGYVRSRLALLKLSTKTLKAVAEGGIPLVAAALVGRLESAEDIKAAEEGIKELLERNDGAVTAEAVRQMIADDILRSVKQMPWDPKDAELVPKAGPCTTCPKNTVNQKDLFQETGDKDAKCSDGDCYSAKVAAFSKITIEKAKAKSLKVLTGSDATRALENHSSGFTKLDETTHVENASGQYVQISNRKILLAAQEKGMNPDITVAVDPKTGRAYELARSTDVKVAEEAWGKKGKIAKGKAPKISAARKAEIKRQKLDRETNVQALRMVYEEAKKRAESGPKGIMFLLELLATRRIEGASYLDTNYFLKRRGVEQRGRFDVEKLAKKGPFVEIVAMAFELEATREFQYGDPAKAFPALGVTRVAAGVEAKKAIALAEKKKADSKDRKKELSQDVR